MHTRLRLASTLVAPGAPDARTVCVRSTITDSGRTRGSRIAEGTGDRRADRGAKRDMEVIDFARLSQGMAGGRSGHRIVQAVGADT